MRVCATDVNLFTVYDHLGVDESKSGIGPVLRWQETRRGFVLWVMSRFYFVFILPELPLILFSIFVFGIE